MHVCVCRENNTISVWNNGKGIPVVKHKVEKVYVPALIFGQLLTSSNYDDDEKKVTGEVELEVYGFILEIDRYFGLPIFFPIFEHFTIIGYRF